MNGKKAKRIRRLARFQLAFALKIDEDKVPDQLVKTYGRTMKKAYHRGRSTNLGA